MARMSHRRMVVGSLVVAGALHLVLVACGSSGPAVTPATDGGVTERDASTDTSRVADAADDVTGDAPPGPMSDASTPDAGAVDAAPTPRDTGPDATDAGPVDTSADGASDGSALDLPYPAPTFRVAYRPVPAGNDRLVVGSADAAMGVPGPTCALLRGVFTFSLRACTTAGECDRVTGTIYTNTTPPVVRLGALTARPVQVTSGPFVHIDTRSTQSVHIQFAVAAFDTSTGATGIPGTTTAPDLADVWLFGCPSDLF